VVVVESGSLGKGEVISFKIISYGGVCLCL
jgi:hypothetical protein